MVNCYADAVADALADAIAVLFTSYICKWGLPRQCHQRCVDGRSVVAVLGRRAVRDISSCQLDSGHGFLASVVRRAWSLCRSPDSFVSRLGRMAQGVSTDQGAADMLQAECIRNREGVVLKSLAPTAEETKPATGTFFITSKQVQYLRRPSPGDQLRLHQGSTSKFILLERRRIRYLRAHFSVAHCG